jgi:hypothetical protein
MRSIVEALRFDRLFPRKPAFSAVEDQRMTLDRPRPEAHRVAWPAQRNTHAGNGAMIAAFINVGEFILVVRIITDAEPERAKRSVPPIPGLLRRLEASRDDMLEIHGDFAPYALGCISLRTRTKSIKQVRMRWRSAAVQRTSAAGFTFAGDRSI